jgi:hypothetical protein
MYTKLNSQRRFIIKGIGALGVGGVIVACGGGSSTSGSGSSSNSSGTGGGSDPTNASKGTSAATCTNSATIPLIIDASVAATGIPANIPIYAYITGLVAVPSRDVYYRYSNLSNKPVEMSTLDDSIAAGGSGTGLSGTSGSTNYPQVWADYSILLDRTCATVAADLATFNTSNIPGFGTGGAAFSGRIWISVGTPKIPFTAFAGTPANQTSGSPVTGYATPNPATGAVGSLCMFDWLEFSYDITGALNINTTQVDQYGFPISMTATGTGVAGGEQGIFNTSRSSILSTLATQSSSLFNGSVAIPSVGVASGTYPPAANTSGILRALAPPNSSGATTSNYLATPITNAMGYWANNILSVTCPSNVLQQTYYGKAVNSTTLNFYTTSAVSGTAVFSFNDITTYNVLNCSGTLAGNGVSQTGDLLSDLQNTGKAILAGFNRGVISSTSILNITASNYNPPLSNNYQSTTIPYNTWALKFHQFSSNGYAYGFSYDDVGSEQPTITTTTTASLKLQLGIFQ